MLLYVWTLIPARVLNLKLTQYVYYYHYYYCCDVHARALLVVMCTHVGRIWCAVDEDLSRVISPNRETLNGRG